MKRYLYIKKRKTHSPIFQIIALTCLFFGLGLLSWLAWPFLEWRLIYAPRFDNFEIIRPLPVSKAPDSKPLVSSKNLRYANNWFTDVPLHEATNSGEAYTLSIPKLKIKNAKVLIGGLDLDKSLIHYGGTALPGEYGTAVVFGHSVLPQFFDPESYKTIFSTIHTLKENDEISVNRDGVEYRYKIFGQEIINPDEFSTLQQRGDDSYLYLVTCTPPGTYWKRLIIKARLKKL
ncbi:sortase [Candidatus Microgenomates bacterium]|nr:sortase [Candidatus Microgenomates bacterium]